MDLIKARPVFRYVFKGDMKVGGDVRVQIS